MKTFAEFQEAALAIPAAAGVISKVLPAAAATIGAVGTIMQSQRGRPKGEPSKRYKRSKPKRKISDMERKLTDRLDRQSVGNERRGKAFDTTGLDLKKKSKIITPKNGQVIQDEFSAPTNNVGGGQIAGTVEAGDNPPVKKKRPPIMARGKLPGARTRFKAGADFLANIKKNK